MNSTYQKISRLLEALGGILLFSLGINLFITPINLYNGGILGACQLLRSAITMFTPLDFGSLDIAGILYYLFNIPLFILAFRGISRIFCIRTIICVSLTTFFLSVIPIPAASFLPNDILGSCLFGGIMSGVGLGLALHSGSSLGGTDIFALYLVKRGCNISIGKINIIINAFIYLGCFLLFDITTALYSIVYSVIMSLALDLVHTQNINVEVLIISKYKADELSGLIIDRLGRGVTRWQSVGGYTRDAEEVLYSVMSKYEVALLQQLVKKCDPTAFLVVKEKAHVYGNFMKKL